MEWCIEINSCKSAGADPRQISGRGSVNTLTGMKGLFKEAAASLFPVAAMVLLLSLTATEYSSSELIKFVVSTALVYVGFVMFLLGAQMGLVPMGRLLGSRLPRLGSLAAMMAVTLAIGFLMTFAEPDLRVYSHVLSVATKGAVGQTTLVLTVALGVGMLLALSILRLAKGIPIRKMMLAGFAFILVLTVVAPSSFVAYAFDSSAVTTGPVTVPFILSLGAGAAAVLEGRHNLSDSFGLIGIASMGPVITVLLLGLILR